MTQIIGDPKIEVKESLCGKNDENRGHLHERGLALGPAGVRGVELGLRDHTAPHFRVLRPNESNPKVEFSK